MRMSQIVALGCADRVLGDREGIVEQGVTVHAIGRAVEAHEGAAQALRRTAARSAGR